MKLYKTLAITALMLGLTPMFSSCGDDNDEPSPLNQYEQQLVGEWNETFTGAEAFNYIFKSDRTGVFYVTRDNKTLSTEDFEWSATATRLTLSDGKQSQSAPYSITDTGTLLITSGDEVLSYKKK
jgi:hypothetical protein